MIYNIKQYSLTVLVCMLLSVQAWATDYVVTNTNDSGPGSLRQAMLDVNAEGPGPHTITFHPAITGGTITLLSDLPVVSVADVTIDGLGDGSANMIIDANGGDIGRYIFRADAGGINATYKNFIVQNTGWEPFRFDGSPSGITIENIVARHTSGNNWLNYGVLYVGNAVDLSIRNFSMTQKQNLTGGAAAAIRVTGTANNVLIDNFDLSDSGGGVVEAIRFEGVADGITIQNSNIDLDLAGSDNDGDHGIRFLNDAANVTIDNVNVQNSDLFSIHVGGASTNFNVSNFTVDNSDGLGTTMGIRFVGAVDGMAMNTIQIDLDKENTTNDGDYGIYFNTNASNVTMDGITIHEPEIRGIHVGGVATNFNISNATMDFQDQGLHGTASILIYFAGATNGVNLTNLDLDCEVAVSPGNSALWGIRFEAANTNVNLTNVNVNGARQDGVRVWAGTTNGFTVDGGSFSNSQVDGIEFYNNVARSGVVIQNAVFDNNGRAGLVINNASATTEYTITDNTFSNHNTSNGHAIWLHSTGGVKDIAITTNIFFNNNVGIYNVAADDVLYSQNSFYNNILGIDNVGNDGNNGYERAAGEVPIFSASVDAGGGNYDLTFTLPAFCTDCDVEFYTNQSVDAEYNGRTYVQTANNLAAGPNTITVNSGGETSGFWTAILTNNDNGSTSEFSDAFPISLQGPANVDAGIAFWARADISGQPFGNFTTNNGWRDYSGNGNHYGDEYVNSDPELVDGIINFNPTVTFDGNDYLRIPNTELTNLPIGNDDRTVFIVSNTNTTGSRTSFSYGRGATNQNQSWRHEDGIIRYIGWGNDFTGAGAFTVGKPFLHRYDHDGSTASINSNGLQISTAAKNYNTQYTAGNSFVGIRPGTSEYFIGDISEVIVYNRNLTAAEKNRVESYLAIKYGITLDQSTATNYVTSDGTVIWDATANAAYSNDIAGIGRDDETELQQKQSKTINTGEILTMGLGSIETTNGANTNTFAADKDFLVWGHDGAATTLQTTELPATAVALNRVSREWKVAETGSVSNLSLAFDLGVAAYDIELYVDTDGDGDFSNATVITGGALINGQAVFTGVDLNDGDHFTLGYSQAAPGRVAANLTAWYKFDQGVANSGDGTPVSNIEDVSGNNYHLSETSLGSQPIYLESGLNFNPAANFDGANDRLNGQYLGAMESRDPITLVSVSVPTALGGEVRTISVGDSWDRPGMGYSGNNMQIREAASTPSAITHSDPITVNTPYILLSSITNDSNPGQAFLSYNGLNNEEVTSRSDGTFPLANGGYIALGNEPNSYADDHTGMITEAIIYNRVISDFEKERIYSYLAIKYGITLNQNYYAGDWDGITGTTLWDLTSNAAHSTNIAGIGRDDLSGLNQKQSRSVNADALVTMGLGSIETSNGVNTNTFAADKSFLMWGNDNGAVTIQTTELPITALSKQRLGREWKVAETGSVNNLTVAFDIGDSYPLAYDLELFIDTDGDGDFSNATVITGGTLIDGQATFAGVDLNDGDLFTIGLTQPAPGGVAADLQVWLKADAGVTGTTAVSTWENQSANDRHADMSFGDPELIEGDLNFNPILDFDGNDYFRFSASPFVTSYTAAEAITILNEDSGTINSGHPYDFGGSSRGFHYTWGNLHVYQGSFTNDRLGFRPDNGAIVDGKTGVAGIVGDPVLTSDWNIYGTHSATNDWGIQFNGQFKATSTTNTVSFSLAGGNEYVGAVSGNIFRGKIGEVILYNRVLTATERLQVNSYTALKYGITLNQSTPTNYLASDASVIWDGTANAAHNNDIAGIGRDDLSALNQKQSRSINTGAVATIGLGSIAATNGANTNTFAADKNFLIWGHDGATTGLQETELPATATALYRMGREWKVAETGSVSNLTVAVDGVSALAYDIELYIDTDGDGDFSNATVITGGTQVDGQAVFAGVDLNDGDLFTLGYTQPAPGGVVPDMSLWVRADIAGQSFGNFTHGNGWKDVSGNGNHFDDLANTDDPELTVGTELTNFNPTVQFDGNDWLRRDDNDLVNFPIGNADRSLFIMSNTTTTASRTSFEYGENANSQLQAFRHENGTTRWIGWNNDFTGTGTFTVNEPFIGRYDHDGSTASINSNGRLVTTSARTYNTAYGTSFAHIGVRAGYPGEAFIGNIPEVILYNRDLTTVEKNRVESYLAIKYGITLDQTTPTNYLAADGTTVLWDATANASFSNDIAGIGRDDLEALNQKQSKSINSDEIVTIGLGSVEVYNEANTNTFATDQSYLVWGNDNASTGISNAGIPASFVEKMNRNWFIQETGTVDNVLVRIPDSAVAGFSDATKLALVVADDAGFTTNVIDIPMVLNGSYYEAVYNFDGARYFSFGIVSSGGVMRHGKYFRAATEQPMKW